MVDKETIEYFLSGTDPQKYITSIEATSRSPIAHMVINDPERGKYIQSKKFKPFIWMSHDAVHKLYGGNISRIKEACKKYRIKIKALTTTNDEGFEPERMSNGYKYLLTTKLSFSNIQKFLKRGGLDIYDENDRKFFMRITPVEQFMIQTGKRLFKGFDDYSDLHKVDFDLETEGLKPEVDRIFQIGIKDNRGFEHIIEVTGDTEEELNKNEILAIEKFALIIDYLKPDIIKGYNSEDFDWNFFEVRCEVLGTTFKNIIKTLNPESSFYTRRPNTLKLGGNTERYTQTYLWGYNIIDIWHAVRKAKAINSDIKKTGLKYITIYSKVVKENRVYVQGNQLNSTWADKNNDYYINESDGKWFKVIKPENDEEAKRLSHIIKKQQEQIDSGDYSKTTGKYIVERYLLDDLWETDRIDEIYNQSTFLVSKILPTTFMKASTMGTSSTWKLIMMGWSYQNNLALPSLQDKRDFTGGLARLLEVGYAKRVAKLDYAALYPNIELTHDIIPDLDISGVMKGMLFYIVDQRDKYKALKNEHGDKADEYKKLLETDPDNKEYQEKYKEHSYWKSTYDKKQLPLKILANSFFGSFGASYLFNWGDVDCAEETTCRGRQYLRLMVRHFYEKYNFKPLVGDSVTYDTPIYIRYKDSKEIDIKAICDIFNANSKVFDEEGLRDFEEKPYEVLTVNGWKNIQYTYRHETEKNIHRITTKDRLVQVTEDHSLFQNGVQIKPSTLKRGDSLDVYKLPHFNNRPDMGHEGDFFWLLGYFLGDGSAIYGPRKQYYKSRKTGETHVNKGVRGEWKISSSNLENLEKLKTILEKYWSEWNIKPSIKDHRKSSSVYNLVVYKTDFSQRFCEDFYTSYREKKIPAFILNSSLEHKRAFMDGVCASDGYGNCMDTVSDIGMKSQVAMSGIGYLLNCLGINYKIKTRKDKENFISFKLRNRNRNNSEFTCKTKMVTDEVWGNEVIQNRDNNNYVYDISTEDGTFIGGIGAINLKNTDGFNFAIPDSVDEISYKVKGTHRLTEKYNKETITGLEAVVADFNEEYMIGRMGLDIDDICESTINFARKNYGNKISGKVKLVGNSLKSSAMPGYIEDFINEGVKMLLDGDGKSFIELYYDTVDKVFNYEIPVAKIASKSKVNQTLKEYEEYCKGYTKAKRLNSRKAFMELLIKNDINFKNGDIVYYVNTGTAKSHGDLKTIKDKETKEIVEVKLQCKLIPTDDVENNPDVTTDEYNVPKYLDALNNKVKPLLVCFGEEVREKLLLGTKKNSKTKEIELDEREYFSDEEMSLISGKPYKEADQDSYEQMMTMEDKEIKFWTSVDKVPNNIDLDEWEKIKVDYIKRMEAKRKFSIAMEFNKIKQHIRKLKPYDFELLEKRNIIPPDLIKLFKFEPEYDDDGKIVQINLKSQQFEDHTHMTYSELLEFKYESEKMWEIIKKENIKGDINSKLEYWDNYCSKMIFEEGYEGYLSFINRDHKLAYM